jgi:hypothetical protein
MAGRLQIGPMFEYRASAVEMDEGHRRDLLNQNFRRRSSLGPVAHDVLRFLLVNFRERVVRLTVRVQELVEFRL